MLQYLTIYEPPQVLKYFMIFHNSKWHTVSDRRRINTIFKISHTQSFIALTIRHDSGVIKQW